VRIFQILIISAVKICKQFVQTGSASFQTPYRGLVPGPDWGLPPDSLGYSSQMKILGVTIGCTSIYCVQLVKLIALGEINQKINSDE